ncbi:DUF4238 domain-containing protein [Actinacidiphila oryziradicis]|uniref:DUF4238 domain-containing protein n=1 Tax=Actinacidiphila oryziradicis TaxID=2571141 RepID=UPI00145F42B4|nr:DUF4238 domain-containing protein [Actinacidiphila oryziradicis]
MGAVQQTSRQHLVSQVILKAFTEPGPRGSGCRLLPFDLRYPERRHKLQTTRACGWVEDFVAFDSEAAEDLWGSIERKVPAALAAVHAGVPFADPDHASVLRDLVVLHFVRSLHYREVHVSAFAKVRAELRSSLVQIYGKQLHHEALRETGLHLTGRRTLGAYAELLIDRSQTVRDHESGKLFRTSVESTFRKVQAQASTWQVEIHTPASGKFLIGDNPAVTLNQSSGVTEWGMPFGDATSMVLPIGPQHLVALGPRNRAGTLSAAEVEALNTVQVYAARRYVYMHPCSGLEAFVTQAARERPSTQVQG